VHVSIHISKSSKRLIQASTLRRLLTPFTIWDVFSGRVVSERFVGGWVKKQAQLLKHTFTINSAILSIKKLIQGPFFSLCRRFSSSSSSLNDFFTCSMFSSWEAACPLTDASRENERIKDKNITPLILIISKFLSVLMDLSVIRTSRIFFVSKPDMVCA